MAPTFLTVRYRDHYIHCKTEGNRSMCEIQSPSGDRVGTSRSMEGAKKKVRARPAALGGSRRSSEPSRSWRTSPKGQAAYEAAKAEAREKANSTGYDYGIEGNDVFKTWNVFLLPPKKRRSGHELRAEVVMCDFIDRCKPGYGPLAGAGGGGGGGGERYTYDGVNVKPIWSTQRRVAGGTAVDIIVDDPRSTIKHATVNADRIVKDGLAGGRSGAGWEVPLYQRLANGKPGKYTFDVLGPFKTKREALEAKKNHAGDRRYVPVIERERSRI